MSTTSTDRKPILGEASGQTSANSLPFTPAIRCAGFVFVSGQVGRNSITGILAGDDVVSQTRQILDNIQALLQASGSRMDLVVKSTCFLKRVEDFTAFNAIYREYFPVDPPARSTVRADLMAPDLMVEIEVIARVADATA